MKLIKSPLLTLSFISLAFAVPASASAAATKEDCAAQFGTGGSNELSAVMDSVTPEGLQGGARQYRDSLKELLVMPSTVPAYISSLPKKAPTNAKKKAAYNEKVKADLQKRKALAARAQDRLKDLYSDAKKDITDSYSERALAIKNNSTNAKNRLTNLKNCNQWNAQSDFINNSRSREDSYQAALNSADDLYIDGNDSVPGTRDIEDQYRNAAQTESKQDIVQQKQCAQDSSYGYDESGNWVQRAKTVPTVSMMNEADARTQLTGAGFSDIIVKQVRTNSGRVNLAVGTSPAKGSRVAPETQVTILIRSNKEKIKGLKPGRIASTSEPVMIAKSSGKKKPKGSPMPKKVDSSRPTEAQVKDCQDRQENDPQFGNQADTDKAKTDMTRELEDAKERYREEVERQSSSYRRDIEDMRRTLTNPFSFVVPYNNAITSLNQMTKVTELRSKRQKTEDERSARDAAKAARDYLTDLYGVRVSV